MAKTKTKLDQATLLEVARRIQALEQKLEQNAKSAAKQGGVLLAHALGEHERAMGCGLVLTTIIDPLTNDSD